MKRLLLIIPLIILAPKISFSQEVKKPVYNKYLFNPSANAKQELANALAEAKQTHRHVLAVIGGDWSYWSREFWAYIIKHHSWDTTYELVFINFSPANRNEAILNELKAPRDRGYPILIVLDENGKNLITTDTDDLKHSSKSYDADSLLHFSEKWLVSKSVDKK